MTIGNYVRAGLVAGIAFGIGVTVYGMGRYHEGNARCLKDGIEERFAVDFPGYNPDADLSDPKDGKLTELKGLYLSGELLEPSEILTPAEQADAIHKGRRAKYRVEAACKKDNQFY